MAPRPVCCQQDRRTHSGGPRAGRYVRVDCAVAPWDRSLSEPGPRIHRLRKKAELGLINQGYGFATVRQFTSPPRHLLLSSSLLFPAISGGDEENSRGKGLIYTNPWQCESWRHGTGTLSSGLDHERKCSPDVTFRNKKYHDTSPFLSR